jgi:2-methylisocitrate lyase-like PEP mutase family enzyme
MKLSASAWIFSNFHQVRRLPTGYLCASAMHNALRSLHRRDALLILPNAWDAGSARVIEACGARAIATTSAGLAWAHGYPDGNVLAIDVLTDVVSRIARVIRVPLSVDLEAGYSDDPDAVGELVHGLIAVGVQGINIEDGTDPPSLLCAKIRAVRAVAERAGVDLFINARIDVYLKQLVPSERARETTIERIGMYRSAGCDGAFVPGLVDRADIRAIADATALPLNVMAMPGLPPAAELATLGVQRLSTGAALAAASLGVVRRLASDFLRDGQAVDALFDGVAFGPTNALFTRA